VSAFRRAAEQQEGGVGPYFEDFVPNGRCCLSIKHLVIYILGSLLGMYDHPFFELIPRLPLE